MISDQVSRKKSSFNSKNKKYKYSNISFKISKSMTCKAIIIVGGPSRGTRFRPLSLDVPKPLFPVGGYPIIWHHLEALAKVKGLKEVLLIGFYEDNVFQKFIDNASVEFSGINIR
jgi:mannose-1-phosphate guanylyltransferase